MISLVFLSYVVPLLFAFVIICLFWRNSLLEELPIKVSLAMGMALGMSSCTLFVWLLIFGSTGSNFFVAETGFLIACIVLLSFRIGHRIYSVPSASDPETWNSRLSLILPACFSVVLVSAAVDFTAQAVNFPHGDWDAWAIWNLHARFLFRGGNEWVKVFSSSLAWSHPDYPMLVPATVARLWTYMGAESTLAPAFVGMVFTFATVALLVSSLSFLRSRNQGFLAGLVLLSGTIFIPQGASEYADVPLGFFILAAVVLFALKDCRHETAYATLAGVMTGFAAWTKNEGLLFLVSIILARFITAIFTRDWSTCRKELFAFGIGLLPIFVLVLYFKTQLAPPNDILSSQGILTMVARLVDQARYLQIAQAFADALLALGNGPGVLLVAYLALTGIKVEARLKYVSTSNLLTLAFMLTGYFLIYVITPYDLGWHLYTSLSRLLLQVWPTALFSFFLAVASPEQLLMKIRMNTSVRREGTSRAS